MKLISLTTITRHIQRLAKENQINLEMNQVETLAQQSLETYQAQMKSGTQKAEAVSIMETLLMKEMKI